MLTRRDLFWDAFSTSALIAAGGCRTCAAVRDANLAVFLSDIHVSGRKMGERGVEEWMCPTYYHEKLRAVVDEILAMRPRPAKCICFGDLAHDRGCDADYAVSYAILKPLEDVGIEIVHGHNHAWAIDWVMNDWGKPGMLRTLCLPSTGHWGGHRLDELQDVRTRGGCEPSSAGVLLPASRQGGGDASVGVG